MNPTESQLRENYATKNTEELLELRSRDSLTELARQVIDEVLASRSLIEDEIQDQHAYGVSQCPMETPFVRELGNTRRPPCVNNQPTTEQSTFVTVLAWALIIFSCFGAIDSLTLSIALINFSFPEISQPYSSSIQTAWDFSMPFWHIVTAFWLFLTYAAYALLRRRNWGRRIYVVLFELIIFFNFVVVCMSVLGIVFFVFFVGDAPVPDLGTMSPGANFMFKAMIVVLGVFAAGMISLFGWLVQRLRSPAVKAEFSTMHGVT